MENIELSFYENAWDNKGKCKISLSQALDRIKDGVSQKLIDEIRKEANKEKRNELKKKLPGITFSGIFTQRANISLHQASGLACLDFDHQTNPENFRDWLYREHDFVLAAWISPSGDGVKALVVLPIVNNDTEYKQYYKALLHEIEAANPDPVNSNISRLCYESWDPDIRIKEFEKVSVFEKKIVKTQKKSSDSLEKENDVTFNQIMAKLALIGEIFIPDNRHNYILKLACIGNRYGITKEKFLGLASNKFKGLEKEEIKTINDVYIRYQDEHGTESIDEKKTKKITKSKIITAAKRNELAAQDPDPKQLYYNLFNEFEIAILAGETGCGKSILAVHILNELCEEGYKVLYYDFELSAKQFQERYKGYQFPENFLIGDWEPDPDDPRSVFSIDTIIADIESSGADIVAVDNISALSLKTTVDQDAANDVMRGLKKLQKVNKISVLVLAHTPKRNQSEPLTINDLAGSKQLANFADSVFFINFSKLGENIRYIKHIKTRTAKIHPTFTVIIEKGEDCMIRMVYNGELSEDDHLNGKPIDIRIGTAGNLRDKEGKTQTQIAQLMKTSQSTVNRLLKEYDDKILKTKIEKMP